jgi:ParB/RepB/Spo0J family partition protein
MPKATKAKTSKPKSTKLLPGEQVVRAPTGLLKPSPTNRPNRSGFDEKSIAELAESIRIPGIIEPLIVRKLADDTLEIVCGERRWTAAKLLKLETVPVVIREMTDDQTRKVQIIENLQREGLHPVEEAQGYADLIAQRTPEGKATNTIDTVAKDIGKSIAFVYGRLKLLEMPQVALDASLNGKCSASIALLLARIPDPKLARKAAIEVLDPCGSGDDEAREKRAVDREVEPMSYRKAKEHIQRHYMKRLRNTPFDQEDEELVPVELAENGERRCGGRCSDCPWRTGNLTLILPGEEKENGPDFNPIAKDVCTNPACFKRKTDAAFRRDSEKAKAQGHTLLRDGKAAQIFRGTELCSDEYVDVRAIFPGEKKKTWEDVLGDELPDNLVQARDEKRKVHFLIEREAAVSAAKKAGRTPPKEFLRVNGNGSNGNGHNSQAEYEKQQAALKAKRELVAPVASALFFTLLPKAEAEPTANWWRWMLRRALDEGGMEFWSEVMGHKSPKALDEWIEKAKPEQLRAVLVAAVTVGTFSYEGQPFVDYRAEIGEGLLDACDFYGVNHKKFIQEKLDELKKAKAAEAKPEAKELEAAAKN